MDIGASYRPDEDLCWPYWDFGDMSINPFLGALKSVLVVLMKGLVVVSIQGLMDAKGLQCKLQKVGRTTLK